MSTDCFATDVKLGQVLPQTNDKIYNRFIINRLLRCARNDGILLIM